MAQKDSKQRLFEVMKKVNPDYVPSHDIDEQDRSSYNAEIYNDVKTLLGNRDSLSDQEIQQAADAHGVDATEVIQTVDYVKKERGEQAPSAPSSSAEAEQVNDFFKFLANDPQKHSKATVQYMSKLDRNLAKPKSNPMVGRFIKLTQYPIDWAKTYAKEVEKVNPDWEIQDRKGGYTKMEGGYGDVMERDKRGDEVLPIVPMGAQSIILVLGEDGSVSDIVKPKELQAKYAEYFQPSFFTPREARSTGSGVPFRPLKLYAINRLAAGGKEWMNPTLKPPFDRYREYFKDVGKTDLNERLDPLDDTQELGEYVKWYNRQESSHDDHEEGFSTVYVLDIPKAEYNPRILDDLKYRFQGSSHGVEGNPGGWVYRGDVSEPEDMGEFVRVQIYSGGVMDI